MIGVLARAAGLTAIYLLVLTSLAPGDVLVGALLGLAVAVALRPRDPVRRQARLDRRVAAALGAGARTAVEMAVGSWRTARFCLGRPARPGFVEIPRDDRSRGQLALWGVLTGEAPDEVVVDVDEARGVLVVHLVDARDPDAVRGRHRREHERRHGREP